MQSSEIKDNLCDKYTRVQCLLDDWLNAYVDSSDFLTFFAEGLHEEFMDAVENVHNITFTCFRNAKPR